MKPTLKAPAAASGRGAAFLTGGSLLFASREEKALGRALDDGLVAVEKGLERELKFSDEITDAVSRHLFDAGGKAGSPALGSADIAVGVGNQRPCPHRCPGHRTHPPRHPVSRRRHG